MSKSPLLVVAAPMGRSTLLTGTYHAGLAETVSFKVGISLISFGVSELEIFFRFVTVYRPIGKRQGWDSLSAFAGDGGVPQPDDILINQASKVTVHANEAASGELLAIAPPGY
jgi:hypothetical protein